MAIQNSTDSLNTYIINDLPDDVLGFIFKELEVKDVVHNMSLACKKWNILSGDEWMWLHFVIRDHGTSKTELLKKSQTISYYALYKCTNELLFVTMNKIEKGIFKDDMYNHKLEHFDRYPSRKDCVWGEPDLRIVPYIDKAWKHLKGANPELQTLIPTRLYDEFSNLVTYHQHNAETISK